MWQGWIDLADGVWLIIAGFIFSIRTPASMLIAGCVAILFGFWASTRSWQGAVNGIIGIWLFVSAVWFNLAVPWNFFISGVIVAAMAIWNISAHSTVTHSTRTT